MKQQKTVESRVLEILKECPMSRYDDMLLILHYYNQYGYIPAGNLPLEDIVFNYRAYGLPCFETIRRARQRVQSLFPEYSRNPQKEEQSGSISIVINNAIYGMTGGQMAPTTLLGMKTATCPYGREVSLHGYPLKITELAANLEGTCYVTRQSVHNVASINRTKKAIRKAFEYSMQGKGSNLVEVVSTCNSGWKMSPEKANKWMEENMFPFYQLGDLKDKGVEL